MADTYSYPLLVELPDGNIPKLKNKLVKYFQSKKSNGGDCEVDYEPGSRTAVLRFRREEDQRNVLAKAAHQISLDKGVIKMTVNLPSEEEKTQETPSEKGNKSDVAVTIKESKADEPNPADQVQTEEKGKEADAADEELCSTSAVLENLSERGSEELLQMLVDNILNALAHSSASQGFNLEIIPEISSAVVTFQSGKVNADFIAQCPQNRMFTKLNFSVRPLEVTKQVLVENIQNTNVDMLQLYFENEGGDVDDLNLNEAEQSAVITFEDCQAVQKVLKKKHHIKNEDIKVYPFYKSLGVALYGKDQPSLKLPAATSVPIDSDIWRYLTNNQAAAQSVRSDMEKHFCDVNLDQSTVQLSPLSLLLKQKDAKATMKDWTTTVKSAFAQAMSKFKSLKFQVESEVWEKSEEKIRQSLLNEDVLVVSEKSSGVLSVVGLVNDVNRQERTVSEALNKINQTVQREKTVKTQEIKVPPSIFHILSQDGLQDKLLQVSPELKTHYDKEAAVLKVTGLFNEIFEVSKIINDGILGLKRENVEVDTFVFDMMKDEQQQELTSALLTSVGINAALEISAQRVQLVALSDKDLLDGQHQLRKFLISQYIDVEDVDVLKKPEWQGLVGQLENANNKRCRITQTLQKVVVSGHKDSVEQVSSELSSFLTQNAHVETTVDVKANVIIDYIKSLDMSWLKDWEDKAAVSFRKEAIFLSGSRASVEQIKILLEDVVASVSFDILRLSKPGVKKLFKDKDSMLLSTIRRDTGCLVQLVDEDGDRVEDWASVQVQKPVYQIKTTDGVEIAVCKADMCSYPVDAVINDSTPALKHSAGLAAALVKAAGPQLQDECDRIISKRQLKPGDCVITGAGGQLCCQKIIHAVGPKNIKTSLNKAEAQLKRTIKGSLELAEKHGCTSVALPAVGRGQGFPLHLCVATVVKAVKDYCLVEDDAILKMIHLVDNDDSVVQAMEGAVKQEFGSHSVVNSPQPLTTKVSKSPPVKHAVDDSCLGRVQTKEGLDIILTKGNIEASTMEVIVNTVSEDFDLTKGAVSRVILAAAGPRLQQMVEAKDPQGTVGEVVVTDGCNLKSQHVYHTVAPKWDKGKSTAKKTLGDILNRCLNLAESKHMSSIAFPAIGTGNLGFPKDLVASLMLEKILAFSSQNHPKNLKKVVIVLYPADAETIKEFSDEFMKKFPSAAHGSFAPNKVQSPAGPFSNINSSSGMHEIKLGNVTIQAVTADITQETTDVIVNSSNANFSLKSGVSKAILEAAGQAVEQECRNLAAQPNPGMIMTQPGNLKCKKILHLHLGTTDVIEINKSVKEALEMCLKTSHTSVSFPAIGTGQGNVQARQVADSMLDAVIEVLSQNTSSTLTTVRIVVFQSHMLKDFSDSMHQRGPIDAKDKGGSWLQSMGSRFKSLFVGKPTESPDKKADFVIVTVQGDPTCFHICGGRQAEVDSAKKRITDLISKGQTNVLVTDDSISNLSQADIQQLIDIQKKLGVVIRSEIMNGQPSIIIEGLQNDVFEVKCAVYDMLKTVREVKEMERNMALVGILADWQYEQGGQFRSFDEMANFELERAYNKSKPRITIKVQGQDYTVVLPNGTATDSQGNVLKIRRNDQLKGQEVPVSWDSMPTDATCQPFPIQPETTEHTDVLNRFQASCKRPVIKIERIQNPTLWKAYQAKKQELEVRNKRQDNEKRLFHGTCEKTAIIVNELGFNRSYAGMNAAAYGNGTYFAVDADYSADDMYSKPNSNKEKIMYLCRVLTGDFCKGEKGMINTPAKGTSSVETYNSVVDNVADPILFVIFHDNQAYPEYMITFK